MATGVPKTYTFAEFHQHTGGDHAGYTKYLRYVANFRANRLAHQNANPLNANALAPIPESVEVPKLHQLAASSVNPLVGAETGSYNHDVRAATNSLAGYSRSLAQFYQPQSQQMMNNTLTATGAMAGANGALGDTLRGGPAGMDDLSHYLGAIGSGAAPQQSALANFGTTGANLLAARGNAAIQGAIGSGTARANTAAFLPTYAAQTGRQTLKQTLESLTGTHQKNVASLLAQEPGMFRQLYQQYVNNEIQKAISRNSGYVAQTNAGTAAARAGAYVTKAAAGTYVATNPVTGKKQTIPAGYVIDKQGRVVKGPSGSSAPASGPGSKRYAQYTSAVHLATSKANTILQSAIKAKTHSAPTTTNVGGVIITNPNGKATSRVANYYGTIHAIEAAVTPLLSPYMGPHDITRWVQKMVNKVYGPGAYGRPGTGVNSSSAANPGYSTHPRP